MIVFTGVYPLLETLGSVPQLSRCYHLLRGINDLTSPMGRKPIADMNQFRCDIVVCATCESLVKSISRSQGERRDRVSVVYAS